jgi:hypothetical protein
LAGNTYTPLTNFIAMPLRDFIYWRSMAIAVQNEKPNPPSS